MEDENNVVMSRYAFERMQAKDERNDLFRNITIIMLIILLVVTNLMWIVAWNQYDYVYDDYTEVDAGDGGYANYIGNDGDISYGTDSSETDSNENAQ